MRVLIIGAGIAGTTLGIFLAQAGLECEIFERAAAPGGGAALAIASNGLAVLEAAGVLKAVDAASVRAGEWAFENQSCSGLACISDARRHTPWQTRMVSRPWLQAILEERLLALGVAIRYGKECVAIEDSPERPAVVRFADGSCAAGDCVVGADGIGSGVRRALWPESPALRYTGMMAYVGFSPCKAHVSPGSEQRVHMIFGRHAFFEYVDILAPQGPRTVWWSTAEASLPARESLSARTTVDHRAHLEALHAGWAEPILRLVRTADSIVALPIHDMPLLPAWSAGRTLVLGDAAHPIGPHSGQASAMALEDAMLLGTLLAEGSGALPEVFRRFEMQRKARLVRVGELGKRAQGRKQTMTPLQYWWLQQRMRLAVPFAARRSKRWLLDYRVE